MYSINEETLLVTVGLRNDLGVARAVYIGPTDCIHCCTPKTLIFSLMKRTQHYFYLGAYQLPFLLSLAPVRPGCSLFLASFPSFSLWPTPIDRVSPNGCLKARHEAVSFEAAEWSERLTSRRVGCLGAAAVGSIPALVTFFSFSSLLLLFLSSLSKPIFILSTQFISVDVPNMHIS